MARRGELDPLAPPPLDAPLCDDAPLEEIVLRLCPLTLCPLTLCPLALCVPLVDTGPSGLTLDEGGGGGGILAPDEVLPAPRPDWVRDGSDALELREDVTWAQCDDNVNVRGVTKRYSGAFVTLSHARAPPRQ